MVALVVAVDYSAVDIIVVRPAIPARLANNQAMIVPASRPVMAV
jgi:hypothetical protein